MITSKHTQADRSSALPPRDDCWIHQSTIELLVLHAVRLRGRAGADDVARMTSKNHGVVATQLEVLAAQQLIEYYDGTLAGWSLTLTGRRREVLLTRDDLDLSGARVTIDHCYRRFLNINERLLLACADWQLRETDGRHTINDHSDADYDAAVIAALADINDRAQPVIADLRLALDRFGPYSARLRAALDRIHEGETEWFANPAVDSYHTVWFELHEDLLTTLGIDRGPEPRVT
jgi:hypothetical protein